MIINEEFISFLWNYQIFDKANLKTDTGEELVIIKQGILNTNSGADFFNAKIKIKDTIWAGNIEIHVNASDWYKHKHELDQAYDNVILHVVYNNDKQVLIRGNLLPVIELKNRITSGLISKYFVFKNSKQIIACGKEIEAVPPIYILKWFERLTIERLEDKTNEILNSLKDSNLNFEEIFYQKTAYGLGLKINAEMMQLLAQLTPLKYINKQSDSITQIEAILLGQAGLLAIESNDSYIQILKKEYEFLKNKYKLTSLEKKGWKYARLRPYSFPEIKIVLFAQLLYKHKNLFTLLTELTKVDAIKRILTEINVSEYWESHFRISKETTKTKKHIGEGTAEIMIINIIVPFMFVYGKLKNDETYIEKALDILNQMSAEKNNITEKFKQKNIIPKNASESQAIIQLFNKYCKQKKCLECNIGRYILRS